MQIVTEVDVQKDGWIRIDPSIWHELGLLGKKARCIFTGNAIILTSQEQNGDLSIVQLMRSRLTHKVSHKQAQQALAGIKGSLSQTTIEDREERC